MMEYKSFDVKDTAAISNFLKEKGDFVPANGIHYHDGNICFIYSDQNLRTPDAEAEKKDFIAHLDAKIKEYKMMMVDSDSISLYWRALARKNVKGADKNVIETADQRANQEIQVKTLEQVKAEVISGTWNTPNSKINEVTLTVDHLDSSEELPKL